MARIVVDLDTSHFDVFLAHLKAATGNFRELLGLVSTVAVQMVAQRFRQKPGWAPLSPVTLARRRKGSSAILEDSGRLRNSIVARQAGAIYELTDTTLEIGSNLVYAATQQFGRASNKMYNTPKGHPAPIPARPYVPTDVEIVDELEARRIVERYISDIVEGRL